MLTASPESLDSQIEAARKEIASDGYEMSMGELINLYRDDELIIHPEFQRLFRWEDLQKTRFIESLLLGIPIPPIFVFQTASGKWELIDGLQRLSTVFEFVGVLKPRVRAETPPTPTRLQGTTFLPGLGGRSWASAGNGSDIGIGNTAQLFIKRSRVRVEILKKESDPTAKYELFQRLNTGGTRLTEQEVRNCVALMIDPSLQAWLVKQAGFASFQRTTDQTEEALKKQAGVELVLRLLAFRNVKYEHGLDVHEYLDKSLIEIANKKVTLSLSVETSVFERTFSVLDKALGANTFKRWDGDKFTGKFLMSLFEVIAVGVSQNIDLIEAKGPRTRAFVIERAKALWNDPVFKKNSGAGIRGTTRLAKLLPMASDFFRP